MIRFERWRPLIDAANAEQDLLRVLNEYCDTWLPSDLALLPAACQRCKPGSADQIGELALQFKHEELKFAGGDDGRRLLHELTQVFIAGAERLKRLRSQWHPPATE